MGTNAGKLWIRIRKIEEKESEKIRDFKVYDLLNEAKDYLHRGFKDLAEIKIEQAEKLVLTGKK